MLEKNNRIILPGVLGGRCWGPKALFLSEERAVRLLSCLDLQLPSCAFAAQWGESIGIKLLKRQFPVGSVDRRPGGQ